MRRFSICVAFILFSSQSVLADPHLINGPSFVNNVIFYLIKNNSLDERFNSNQEFGRSVCQTSGVESVYCRSVQSIGQGICYAGGVESVYCQSVQSIGQGICYAGGVESVYCRSVQSIGQGLDLANRSGIDLRWAWDNFQDEYGNLTWRCRGTNTRQFADNAKCSGEPMKDIRWPGPVAHY